MLFKLLFIFLLNKNDLNLPLYILPTSNFTIQLTLIQLRDFCANIICPIANLVRSLQK
jgi:hypothetical protein